MEILSETKSICPDCLKVIDAKIINRDNETFIEKACPEHGMFSAIIWRGKNPSWKEWNSPDAKVNIPHFHTVSKSGCPYDCGLCSKHTAQTCSVLFEVTRACNMGCPVCFAESDNAGTKSISLDDIRHVFKNIIESGGPYPLQLSGGEPTVRDDLPVIVEMAKSMGFPHVQINTNGIRIAESPGYLQAIKDAGTDLIYLQLDGVSDEVYIRIRGRALAEIKLQAIRNCADLKIAVQFVPTIIRGINDGELGDIIALAKEFMPAVKGIHFQPVSYFGRYPGTLSNDTRMTLPDVLHALDSQTGGEIAASHFLPRLKHDAHCGFSGFFIPGEDGRLRATTSFASHASDASRFDTRTPAEHVRDFIINKSRYYEEDHVDECECQKAARLASSLLRAKKYGLSISGMPFMDAWTLDLERLQNCCIHVAKLDGRMVPFCANYLTDIYGNHLPEFRGERL